MADHEATQRRPSQNLVAGKGEASTVKHLAAIHELAAAAASDTVTFGRIPSNARPCGVSRVYKDDCATTGSPTIDLGLFAVNGNITSDDDALNDGVSLSATAAWADLIKDPANIGKRAWEYVNGQTSDPGGEFIVRGTIKDASTTQTGTIALDMYYVID